MFDKIVTRGTHYLDRQRGECVVLRLSLGSEGAADIIEIVRGEAPYGKRCWRIGRLLPQSASPFYVPDGPRQGKPRNRR